MARFTQKVVETRTITVTYEVEADTIEEAKDKVALGDTADETPHAHTMEVQERNAIDEPEEISEDAES